MSCQTLGGVDNISVSKKERILLLTSIFCISFSILTFEITMIRIFSVMFNYHYTFLAVSLALFGLGFGGALSQKIKLKGNIKENFSTLSLISMMFSLLVPLITAISLNVFYLGFVVVGCLMFFPFFIAGIFLSLIYKTYAIYGNVLYFFDLIGAALGCLGSVFFLNLLNALDYVVIISVISLMGSVLLSFLLKKRKILYFFVFTLVILFFTSQYFKDIRIGIDKSKEEYAYLNSPFIRAEIIESRWSAFGRTDLVDLEDYPDRKIIFIDGTAPTFMYQFNGDFSDQNEIVNKLKKTAAYFPLYFSDKDKFLIIGPGGGVDVLIGLISGANEITAVEVNSDIVRIVRNYSEFNNGIYKDYKNVHILVDEGRSFLKRTTTKYDVIELNQPVTRTTQGLGGYALSENYLFTTDSFRDYLAHLEDNGYLIIVTHGSIEINKLTAIAIKILQEMKLSIKEAMKHIIIIENRYEPRFPVFVLKKTSFTEEEIGDMLAKAKSLDLKPIYFPYEKSKEMSQILIDLENEKINLNDYFSLFNYDVRPPNDNKPFFYKLSKGIPSDLSQLFFGTLISSAIFLLYLLRKPRKKRCFKGEKRFTFMSYYFSSLGLGFMMIEVSLVQKFILFLGHPTHATSIILFSLLISMGLGSLYIKKWERKQLHYALIASLIVGIIINFYIVILHHLFNTFLSLNMIYRFLISFVLIFPIGFFMGMPFPSGIRILEKNRRDDIAWMWCLNGFYSLLGSIMAVVLAMTLGFNIVFLLGGLIYLGIFVVGYFKFMRIGKQRYLTLV